MLGALFGGHEAVALADGPKVLALWREATVGRAGDNQYKVDNNVTDQRVKGNSRSYTLSRLKREAPQLFQKVVDGELSANAAAIFRSGPRAMKSGNEGRW